ncbi:coenzyme A transporter [Elasticomyces elasticus]|nr:hypothetical protein LTR28_003805 [Elasticomyces elasticus]KAK4981395.1 coenzyme A transporter [Elasticomyces elasticus]
MPASIAGRHVDNTETNRPREMISNATAGREPAIYPTEGLATVPLKKPRGRIDNKSWDYVMRSGLAGGMAGCAAKTIVAPLDRVKILFQTSNPQFAKYTGSWFGVLAVMRDIRSTSGIRGLFRGHSATLLKIFPYAGIKFLAYEQIRARIIKDQTQETPLRRLMSGSLAGIVSTVLTYPLEVIRVRLAFETKEKGRTSLFKICKTIYRETPPAPAPTLTATSSPVARTAASTLNATSATVQQVTRVSGLTNFFRGFVPTLVGMLPYAGTSFLTHDMAGDLMRHPRLSIHTVQQPTQRPASASRDSNKPPPLTWWAELITGGLAGIVSQTVSYPLEVIRRRMQVGGVVGDGHRLRMLEVIRRVLKERGWRGFFVGLSIGYVKMVPMTATSFFVYERGKTWLGI